MTIEIYVSTDIETDGPIPGPHSMLSIGSAAYTADKQLIATFAANLEPLPGAQGHPQTMKWWSQQPAAWEACQVNPKPPAEVMQSYQTWIQALPGDPIFVAYPAAFDFMFVYWYFISFVGSSPFSHSALDIRSYAMAFLKQNYRESGKQNLPTEWLEEMPLTHVALDDAIQQGKLFCNLLQNNLQREH
jgi:DNA polymerase III alpha subunit (gram-positive type)